MFDQAVAIGRKRLLSQRPSLSERLLDPVLDRVVRAKMRERFGGRLKAMVSGGAPLNPEIGRFFLALGVTLLQGYGQTEAGPRHQLQLCRPGSRSTPSARRSTASGSGSPMTARSWLPATMS